MAKEQEEQLSFDRGALIQGFSFHSFACLHDLTINQ
jgi:hypothetical protein